MAVSHLSTCVGVGGGSFPWRAEDVTYFLGQDCSFSTSEGAAGDSVCLLRQRGEGRPMLCSLYGVLQDKHRHSPSTCSSLCVPGSLPLMEAEPQPSELNTGLSRLSKGSHMFHI